MKLGSKRRISQSAIASHIVPCEFSSVNQSPVPGSDVPDIKLLVNFGCYLIQPFESMYLILLPACASLPVPWTNSSSAIHSERIALLTSDVVDVRVLDSGRELHHAGYIRIELSIS